jgi:hypothetical protein
MNDKLFDYTVSMQDMAYQSYYRSLLMFLVLFLICISFIFRASPRVAIIIATLSVFVFLVFFPGRII